MYAASPDPDLFWLYLEILDLLRNSRIAADRIPHPLGQV